MGITHLSSTRHASKQARMLRTQNGQGKRRHRRRRCRFACLLLGCCSSVNGFSAEANRPKTHTHTTNKKHTARHCAHLRTNLIIRKLYISVTAFPSSSWICPTITSVQVLRFVLLTISTSELVLVSLCRLIETWDAYAKNRIVVQF